MLIVAGMIIALAFIGWLGRIYLDREEKTLVATMEAFERHLLEAVRKEAAEIRAEERARWRR
jgi:hypothetical protein